MWEIISFRKYTIKHPEKPPNPAMFYCQTQSFVLFWRPDLGDQKKKKYYLSLEKNLTSIFLNNLIGKTLLLFFQ